MDTASLTTSTTSPITIAATGLIYRNPQPHLRSVQAYFPSVVALGGEEMLATLVLGEAFEAANLRTYVAHSLDSGQNWTLEGPVLADKPGDHFSNTCRITALGNNEVVAFLMRHDRWRQEHGFTNPQNLGFVETELTLMRSHDGGRTWQEPVPLAPPLVGPSFEMCSPITPLRDGRWFLPTSTWRGWEGDAPNGMKMVALISLDQGASWPGYVDVMADPEQAVIYWESKIVELPDGRLVAVAWAYNEKAGHDLPNHYAVSSDGGRSFGPPTSTGIQGQTLTPIVLADGKVLVVYRRVDKSGLWANVVRMEGDRWINESETPLWGANRSGLVRTDGSMVENFHVLRFGAPCLCHLPSGEILVVFWCVENEVANIRWLRLRVG